METEKTGEAEKAEETKKTEEAGNISWPQADRKEDDEAYLIFTSGTTGTDKCVVRTQRNTAAVLKEICSSFAYGREKLLILPAVLSGYERDCCRNMISCPCRNT